MRKQAALVAVLAAAGIGAASAFLAAQGRGGSEWTTSGYDAQRSGSIRSAWTIAR